MLVYMDTPYTVNIPVLYNSYNLTAKQVFIKYKHLDNSILINKIQINRCDIYKVLYYSCLYTMFSIAKYAIQRGAIPNILCLEAVCNNKDTDTLNLIIGKLSKDVITDIFEDMYLEKDNTSILKILLENILKDSNYSIFNYIIILVAESNNDTLFDVLYRSYKKYFYDTDILKKSINLACINSNTYMIVNLINIDLDVEPGLVLDISNKDKLILLSIHYCYNNKNTSLLKILFSLYSNYDNIMVQMLDCLLEAEYKCEKIDQEMIDCLNSCKIKEDIKDIKDIKEVSIIDSVNDNIKNMNDSINKVIKKDKKETIKDIKDIKEYNTKTKNCCIIS